ncbi:phosphopantetheine-binding protein [Streptomyces sp. BBFR2]|uniref:phosphopantetheine-binding protein n=1 Tax=Streptomyces sp. BBFR2 TaxID=3372854 RepID=UPI0037D993A7
MSLYEKTVDRVQDVIRDMAPNRKETVSRDERLIEELGYDSISFLELALALESEFNLFEFDEEQAENLLTVGDVSDVIGKLVVAAAAE